MENLQAAPVTGPVTDRERTYAIDALRSTQALLHQSITALTDGQLAYKPADDRWSVAECVEHIALIERGIFAAIQKGMDYPANPEKRAEIKYSDVDVIKAVRSRAVTLPSPEPFIPTGRFESTRAALEAFDQQREAVIAYVQTVTDDLRTHYFRHIALGWLDSYQAILLLAAHGERHRKQIDEVKDSPGFPSVTDFAAPPLPILYQSADLVAINKPHGLLVHRSPMAADASEFAVQLLRDQLGQRVYPVHRLDRKTGGVLLFALTEAMNAAMQQQFMDGHVGKTYLAIVRGYTPDEQAIDYPLRRDNGDGPGTVQEAFTMLKTLRRTEVDVPFGKHPTSRYSLVELTPTTGRMHQLRKHMAHILHPIIGDRPHGCNKQNKLFVDQFGMNTMLLHAQQIQFRHPVSAAEIMVTAPWQEEFGRMLKALFGQS